MPADLIVPSEGEAKHRTLASLSDGEFARIAGSPPAWQQRAWEHAQAHGLDKLTNEEIDAEIDAYRREKHRAPDAPTP